MQRGQAGGLPSGRAAPPGGRSHADRDALAYPVRRSFRDAPHGRREDRWAHLAPITTPGPCTLCRLAHPRSAGAPPRPGASARARGMSPVGRRDTDGEAFPLGGRVARGVAAPGDPTDDHLPARFRAEARSGPGDRLRWRRAPEGQAPACPRCTARRGRRGSEVKGRAAIAQRREAPLSSEGRPRTMRGATVGPGHRRHRFQPPRPPRRGGTTGFGNLPDHGRHRTHLPITTTPAPSAARSPTRAQRSSWHAMIMNSGFSAEPPSRGG
jgi:hypothetical protein